MLSFHLRTRFIPVLTISSFLILLTACNSEEDIDQAGVASDVVTETASGDVDEETAPEAIPAVSVSWVAPAEREDGSALSMAEIAGYRVYYGGTHGDYTNQVDIADSATMQITFDDLAAGTYYFVVTVVDADGRESGFSQEVTRSI